MICGDDKDFLFDLGMTDDSAVLYLCIPFMRYTAYLIIARPTVCD